MRIEKVSENKIKVMFDSTELEENNISVHSFLSNSFESQKLFLAILDIADEEFGFNTKNCKVSCETISFNNKNFVVIVTRQIKSPLKTAHSTYNLLDMTNFSSTTNNLLGNNHSLFEFETDIEELIYKFNNLEEISAFCTYFVYNFPKLKLPSFLYQYGNIFFIKIDFLNTTIEEKRNIISVLSEFETNLCLSKLTILKLEEYSKLLIKTNAIQVLHQKCF